MNENIERMIINKQMSIKEAMGIIDSSASKTVFLVEDGVLEGTLTDGDVRRHLLKGGGIQDNVCNIVNFHPKVFRETDCVDYQSYMIANDISAIPIVTEGMKIIRIEFLNKPLQKKRKIEANVPVVMMAGGKGTRLRPYTEIIPKPLIPIDSKTISEHIFDSFLSSGCSEFYMILNYKKNLIKAYFDELGMYDSLYYIEEPFFMGTGGGVQLVKEYCPENFFLVNCDTLLECDYYEIWKKHIDKQNVVTIVTSQKKVSIPYGCVIVREDGYVKDLEEKPEFTYCINTGMYLCNHKIFSYMHDNEKIDMPELIRRCIHVGGKVGQYEIDEKDWYDMGQMEGLTSMKSGRNVRGEKMYE